MDEPYIPWKRAKKNQASLDQERRRGSKGSLQLNSGRTSWASKRDVVYQNFVGFLEECRTTKANQFTIKVDELKKLTSDAFFHHVLPSMPIDFETQNERWVLIRQDDLDYLTNRIIMLQGDEGVDTD